MTPRVTRTPVRIHPRRSRAPHVARVTSFLPMAGSRATTIFEQVLLTNSVMIVISALATYLITHISYEPYHYLIDTVFVVVAAVAGVGINLVLLRRAFQPLFGMLTTIQAVQNGHADQRVRVDVTAADVAQLAHAFNGMLDSLEEARQARLRSVAQAQETERRRLALELHDATGQEITALMLRLEVVRQEVEEVPMNVAGVQAEMAEVMLLAQLALHGVQRLAQQLRPTILDDLGLSAALHWLAAEMQRGTLTRITVTANEPRVVLTEHQALRETMLFRVAQEALTNALRHSAAATVHLILRRTTRHLILTVRDDGTGFSLADHGAGTGLGSMQERMTLIGGRCAIRSVQGVGTTIIARAPLRESETDE